MNIPNGSNKSQVFMTCVIDEIFTWENISPQHIVAFIYSGELIISYGKKQQTFVTGDVVLVPKNQLSRSIKKPLEGKPFKCVSMILSEEQLRKFYLNRSILSSQDMDSLKYRPIKPHKLFDTFFESLLPYFEMQDELPEELIPIKTQEILTIIDTIDKRASTILGTFREIGKIDLEKYMEEHYMYNLPLEKFAFLTGRSLSTFKSDFKKLFNNTPGKWLTTKRLELAYHKLTAEKLKSSDIYLSVGFENLSHFSFAFKKAFGKSPSSIS